MKVKIPVGLKTPIQTHPSPVLIHVTRGRLKHVRGKVINIFGAGDVFVESNNGGEHYVKSIEKNLLSSMLVLFQLWVCQLQSTNKCINLVYY